MTARQQEQAFDQVEEALVAALLAFLLAQGVVRGSQIQRGALLNAVRTVMAPYALVVGAMLLHQAPIPRDMRDWRVLADEIIEDVVTAAYPSVVDEFEKIQVESRRQDVYQRTEEGPTGVESWARRIAAMIVIGVTEGMKEGIAEQLGFTERKWLTRLDNRVRSEHVFLEGVIKPIGQPFITKSGIRLMYPGDRRAPISSWINCRCSTLWMRSERVPIEQLVEVEVEVELEQLAAAGASA